MFKIGSGLFRVIGKSPMDFSRGRPWLHVLRKYTPAPFMFSKKNETDLKDRVSSYTGRSLLYMTHLGSIGDSKELWFKPKLLLNSSLTLPFTIRILQKMAVEPQIPLQDQKEINRLIKSYSQSLALDQEAKALGHSFVDDKAYVEAKKSLKKKILASLKKEEEIFLDSGYAAMPAGHAISIQLVYNPKTDTVAGRVFNRGEGLFWHSSFVKELDREYSCAFDLQEVSFSSFEGSLFLDAHLELNSSVYQEEGKKLTEKRYDINDFYVNLLNLFPGKCLESSKALFLGAQRGGVCALKAWQMPIQDRVSYTTSLHILLMMRMEGLRAYLDKGALTQEDVSHLKWAKGKLNQTLLEIKAPFSWESEEVEAISLEIEKKIEESHQETIKNLAFLAKEPFVNQVMPSIMNLQFPQKIALKGEMPEKISPFLVDTYDVFWAETTEIKKKEVLFAYLQTLPFCLDPVWESNRIPDRFLENLLTFTLSKDELNLFRSGDETAVLCNVLAGLFCHLKKQGVDLACLSQESYRALDLIKKVLPLLRTTHPESQQKMMAAMQMLEKWITPPIYPIHYRIDDSYQYLFLDERVDAYRGGIRSDPVYALILRKNNYSSKAFDYLNSIFYSSLYAFAKDREVEPELVKVKMLLRLFSACLGHLLGIEQDRVGFYFRKEDTKITYEYIGKNSKALLWRNLNPTYGLGVGSFCDWREKDRRVADVFLDRRMPAGEKEPLDRTSQNKQMKVSANCPMSFAGCDLTPQEVGELFLITQEDNLLIPTLIGYFQKHLLRLENPYMGILFEGLLASRSQDGKEPVLSSMLLNTNNQVGDHLLNFLQKSLFGPLSLKGVQGSLVRALAQSYGYLLVDKKNPDPVVQKRLERAEKLLKFSIERLLRDGSFYSELMALYPYVKGNKEFLGLLEEAYIGYQASNSQAPLSHLIRADLKKAIDYFEEYDLPDDRLPSFVYCSLYSLLKGQNLQITSKLDRVTGIKTYFFKDQGIENQVQVMGKSFLFSRLHPDSDNTPCWFTLISDKEAVFSSIKNSPLSLEGFLTKKSIFFASEKEKGILFQEKDPFTPLCFIQKGQVIHPTNRKLSLLIYPDEMGPSFKKVLAFDEAEKILSWKNEENVLQMLEFPSYDLIFTRIDEKRWKCELPDLYGFYLENKESCLDLEPYLHYLVLRNEKGDRVAIMPNRQVSKFPYEEASTRPFFSPRVLVFPLTAAGELQIPLEVSSLGYLIYLSLQARHYERARELVDFLALHPTNWSDEEKQIIQAQETSSTHPYACALRVRMKLIEFDSIKTIEKERLHLLEEDYLNCLAHRDSLGVDWVSLKEERNVLKHLENLEKLKEPVILNNRRQELGVKIASAFMQEQVYTAEDRSIGSLKFSEDLLQKMIIRRQKPLDIPLYTRPNLVEERFNENFLYYYEIATDPSSKERENLKALLLASYPQNKEEQESLFGQLHFILSATLSRQTKYPSIETMLDLAQKKEMIAETLKQGEKKSYKFFSQEKNEELQKIIKTTSLNTFPEKIAFLSENDYTASSYLQALIQDLSIESQLTAPIPKRRGKLMNCVDITFCQSPLQKKVKGSFFSSICSILSGVVSPSPPSLLRIQRTLAPSLAKEVPFLDRLSLKEPPLLQKIQPYLQVISKDLVKETLQEEMKDLENLQKVYEIEDENPSTLQSCKRTKEGIESVLTRHQKELSLLQHNVYYEVRESQANELVADLKAEIQRDKEDLSEKEQLLERSLRKYPAEIMKQVRGGLIREPTLQRCLVYFAKRADDQILHANPGLREQFQEIKTDIAQFLVDKTILQHKERVLKKLEEWIEIKKEGSPIALKSALEHFFELVGMSRAYEINHPHFQCLLTFEALAGIRLRRDQVDALEEMTLHKEGVKIELEARTGFGKSQVLIPLWLFLTSNQKKLTVMVVPSPLLKDQERHLKRLLGYPLGKGVQTILFSRQQASDPEEVSKLNRLLGESPEEGRIVLTDMKTLQGVVGLALKDALYREIHRPSLAGRNLIQELITLKKTIGQAYVFIDESADNLDPRQRYDYAVGDLEPLSREEIELSHTFWLDILLSDEILSQWNFEFLPNLFDKNKQTLTNENFKLFQEQIAYRVLARLDPCLNPYKEMLVESLLNGAVIPHETLVEWQTNGVSLQALSYYEMCRKQITEHLTRTLLKTCDTDYTLYEKRLAIPAKKGLPKITSEFASQNDAINVTIQANLKTPLDDKTVFSYIEHLQQLFLQGQELSNTLEGQFFFKMKDILQEQKKPLEHFNHFKQEDCDRLKEFLYLNPKYMLDFLSVWILPQMQSSPYKISGTSFSVISALSHVHVTSGTTNPDVTHPDLKPKENVEAPIGNLISMYRHSKLHVLPLNTSLSSLIQLASLTSPPVIIDAGGLYQDLQDSEIVQIFLQQRPDVFGVCYYDDEGSCRVFERGAVSSIPREKTSLNSKQIAVFIRQSNAIGADVPMPVTAKGMVTISKDVLEGFFLQGIGRMRGLQTGQTIDFYLTPEVEQIIQKVLEVDKVTKEDCFRYLKKVEGRQRGMDYFVACSLLLEDLIERSLWTSLESSDLLRRFKKLESRLVLSVRDQALKSLEAKHQEVSPKEALSFLINAYLEPFKKLDPSLDFRSIEQEFYAHVDLNKFCRKVTVGETKDVDAVIEQELAIEQETEQENIQENISAKERLVLAFTPVEPVSWNGNYTNAFKTSIGVFSEIGVYESMNFKLLAKDEDISHILRKPSHQMLLEVDKQGKIKVLLMDHYDTNLILEKLSDKAYRSNDRYYLLSGLDVIASNDPKTPTKIFEVLSSDKVICLGLLKKAFTGEGALQRNEEQWLQKHPREASEFLSLITPLASAWPKVAKLAESLRLQQADSRVL